MPFMHPILFWMGLIAVAIPIIIYLVNRRRFRVLDWAAMSFLLAALRRTRKRLHIEELILLALRCLILLLLAAGLARFAGCGAFGAFDLGNGGRTVVIVLDDSYSTGQVRAGKSVFNKAREDVKQIIAEMASRDRLAILLTSSPSSGEAFFPLGELTDRQFLIGRLDALQPSSMRTNLADTIETADDLFENVEGKKSLFLLSDFRRVDLADRAQAVSLASRVDKLRAQGVKIVVMDFGQAAQKNLTIEKIGLASRFALAGQPARIAIAVRNNGQHHVENMPIELAARFYEDGKSRRVSLPKRMIASLGPSQVWKTEIPFTPASTGSVVIEAKLPADDLPGDNEAFLSLDVRRAAKVLMVDGLPNAAVPEDAESYFIATALDPAGDGSHGFDVETISRDKLNSVEFGDYDLVMLLNVSDFPLQPVKTRSGGIENYPAAAALEKYVASGGGVVIYTGDQVDTAFYNGRLYNRGLGLSPLLIRQPVGDSKLREKIFKLDPASISPTGLMKFFAGPAIALTQLIRFFAITPSSDEVLAEGETSIALGSTKAIAGPPIVDARFNDRPRSPAVVWRQFGQGRVVMFYSTASLRWNDWAMDSAGDVQGLFVLFAAELAESLARKGGGDFTKTTGSDVSYILPDDLRDAAVSLLPPGRGSDLVMLVPQQTSVGLRVSCEKVRNAGVYRMKFTSPDQTIRNILFARNPDPLEGRLEPGSRQEISAAFGRGDFSYINRSPAGQADLTKAVAEKQHWVWILSIVLVLLGLEMYLAMRFGHWQVKTTNAMQRSRSNR